MVIMVSSISFAGCSQAPQNSETAEGCTNLCGKLKLCNHGTATNNSNSKDVCGSCGKDSCDKNCSGSMNSNQGKDDHVHTSSCNSPGESMQEKVNSIFSKAISVEEIKTGYDFAFKESFAFSSELLEFVKMEQGCCGSFTYGLVFDPDKKTIHLQIYGSKKIKKQIAQMIPMLGVEHLVENN